MKDRKLLDRFEVQALLAVSFAGAVIAGFFLDKISAEAFLGIAGSALSIFTVTRKNGRGK